MKAFIGSEDWADEGDVFFFSIATEEELKALKDLINIFAKFDIFPEKFEVYWGTNEFFRFNHKDFIDFIDKAVDIIEEELEVFKKFGVDGFDIYKVIRDSIFGMFWDDDIESDLLTKEDLKEIEPYFLEVFCEEDWENIKRELDV